MSEPQFRSVKDEVRNVMAARTELSRYFGDVGKMSSWLDGVAEGLTQLSLGGSRMQRSLEGAAAVLGATVRDASMYCVEDEMLDVAEAAAKHSTFPSFRITRDELPAPVGLLVLPRPVLFEAQLNPHLATRGLDPGQPRDSVVTLPVEGFFWNGVHGHDARGGASKFIAWTLVNPRELAVRSGTVDQDLLEVGDDTWLRDYPRLFPSGHCTLPFAAKGWTDSDDAPEEELRLLKTIWLLMMQRIASTQVVPGPKHEVKKAQKKNRPIPTVTVINLRRSVKATAEYDREHPKRKYSHRFIVGGHWRTYKADRYSDAVKAHPQWISPFVKGDDDAPLVMKEKVYRWAR